MMDPDCTALKRQNATQGKQTALTYMEMLSASHNLKSWLLRCIIYMIISSKVGESSATRCMEVVAVLVVPMFSANR